MLKILFERKEKIVLLNYSKHKLIFCLNIVFYLYFFKKQISMCQKNIRAKK